MEILFLSIAQTAQLVLRMGAVMFASLFGVELLMQLGLMRYLQPLGKPVARMANLPSESALSFFSAIGSMIAAHTMSAQFHHDGRLTNRELIATGVLNTVPFHFKETFTFQLPIVLPLLGLKLCLIYITAFWLAGLLKIAFVIIYGRLRVERRPHQSDAFAKLTCNPDDTKCQPRSWRQLLVDTWRVRRKLFTRMIVTLAVVMLLVQLLVNSGAMSAFERLILPLTSLLNLPPAVVGPISAYVFSPTVGITTMSNMLQNHLISPYHAIVALLAAGLIMIPVTRLRRTLPRYTAIYGIKPGTQICALTAALSMLSRLLVLMGILLMF